MKRFWITRVAKEGLEKQVNRLQTDKQRQDYDERKAWFKLAFQRCFKGSKPVLF